MCCDSCAGWHHSPVTFLYRGGTDGTTECIQGAWSLSFITIVLVWNQGSLCTGWIFLTDKHCHNLVDDLTLEIKNLYHFHPTIKCCQACISFDHDDAESCLGVHGHLCRSCDCKISFLRKYVYDVTFSKIQSRNLEILQWWNLSSLQCENIWRDNWQKYFTWSQIRKIFCNVPSADTRKVRLRTPNAPTDNARQEPTIVFFGVNNQGSTRITLKIHQ